MELCCDENARNNNSPVAERAIRSVLAAPFWSGDPICGRRFVGRRGLADHRGAEGLVARRLFPNAVLFLCDRAQQLVRWVSKRNLCDPSLHVPLEVLLSG